MEDAAHSLRLALEREEAGARAPGGRGAAPVAGTAARFPVPAQPRAAHPADRDQRLRVQPAAAGRDLGRASPSSGSWTGSRPSRPASAGSSTTCSTSPRSSRASCGCSGTGATSRWCSTRRSPACRRSAPREVTLTCDPSLPAVWADHDRLEQVFVNLLGNAVGHNPPGTRVRVTADAPGRPQVLDQRARRRPGHAAGAGRRAVRAGPPPRRRAPGAGLGLSIAGASSQAHGGLIELAAPAGHRASRVTCRSRPDPAAMPEATGDGVTAGASGAGR